MDFKKNEYASNSFIILKQILLLCYLKAVSCTQWNCVVNWQWSDYHWNLVYIVLKKISLFLTGKALHFIYGC